MGDQFCLSFDDFALLGREPIIAYGEEARDMVFGRRVLVTGAGGSIGSELVRQLHALQPEMLFLLDHDESSMHSVQLELYGDGQLSHERTILADIRDRRRLADLFCEVRPDLIFHAAAHKHLSILERYPSEAVRTNVLGTDNVVRAAQACGAQRLTFISTDKAANPSSILGASKRVAEILVQRGATKQLRTS
jgi:FlaA1/EpsC-like NDP-sugar epimerase